MRFILTVLFFCVAASAFEVNAQDESLDCFLCHKHKGLSRIDDDGKFRLFYINQELFESGPHRKNRCVDCHSDVDRVPHKEAKKVDCSQECHIEEPSGKRRFSHEEIENVLERSVHGTKEKDGSPKPNQQDYPGCKDCHDQPLYRPLSFYIGEKSGVSRRGIGKCKSCHKTGDFAEAFYEHVTSRLHKTRSPVETIQVCAKCHDDEEMRARHELDDAVTSYKETFHYKMIALGSEQTPDCVDCHVVIGENAHFIESRKVETSSTHPGNIATTCRASECHEKADAKLAGFQTHVTYSKEKYPLQFFMLLFFKALLVGVMYFFLALIFLELMRRLFPDFSFKKSEREEAARRRAEKVLGQ
ncbi:MAG: hypothetical protein AB2805_05720 [Candidatus Thiodiazotropha sp.]